MSRWEPIRLRNALTESYNDGRSIDQIMHEHGLSERTVCDHLDANRAGFGSYRDEAYQEYQTKAYARQRHVDTLVGGLPRGGDAQPAVWSNKSQTVSKRSEMPVKVTPSVPAKDLLGALLDTLERTVTYKTDRICTECDNVIPPTGKRGRPRTKHEECK